MNIPLELQVVLLQIIDGSTRRIQQLLEPFNVILQFPHTSDRLHSVDELLFPCLETMPDGYEKTVQEFVGLLVACPGDCIAESWFNVDDLSAEGFDVFDFGAFLAEDEGHVVGRGCWLGVNDGHE